MCISILHVFEVQPSSVNLILLTTDIVFSYNNNMKSCHLNTLIGLLFLLKLEHPRLGIKSYYVMINIIGRVSVCCNRVQGWDRLRKKATIHQVTDA